ncbi:ABC transporter ATP-binding protein [Egicoccus sp. AB-alg2]|uniref:ABC transporter ATP-binding protein n=1 Tax=Egicoccus sp. AB-alg2 TaxID=3242693 RepID=UPI00359EBE64
MPAAIEVEGLHRRYGDTVAVDDVSFEVRHGEIFGVLGPNGAGKTTTVEIVAGLRRADRGRVRVLGLDPERDRSALRRVLGVQLQRAALHGALKVHELVTLFRSFYPRGRDPDELMRSLGLDEQRDTRFDDLSGGQQQRLSIALALVGDPRVTLLDELSTGLDPEARRGIWRLVEDLRDQGVTIVLVSHQLEEVERLCDRVAVLDRGRVVALDRPDGLAAAAGLPPSASLEDAYLALTSRTTTDADGGRR